MARRSFSGLRNDHRNRIAIDSAPAVNHQAEFAAGSMLPKVVAACDFARATGKPAVIGALSDIDAMLAGTAGTRVVSGAAGVTFTPG